MSIGDAVTDASHTDGILFGRLQLVEPFAKCGKHLVVIGEPLSEAIAVTSRRIEQQHTVVAGIAHGGVIGQAVGERGYEIVIARHDDAGGWGDMTLHGIVGREVPHDLRVLLILAQEIAARPYMRHLLVHRNNGIEENSEVRTHVILGMGGDDRCQVTTGREAHDTHVTGVDAPDGCGVAHDAETLPDIAHRNHTVTFRQTIVHHEIGNTLLVEPVGGHCSLVGVRQNGVTTARDAHNGLARWFRGEETHHLCLTIFRQVECKLPRGLVGLSRLGHPRHLRLHHEGCAEQSSQK